MALIGPVVAAGFHTYIGPVLEIGHGARSSGAGAMAKSAGDFSHGAKRLSGRLQGRLRRKHHRGDSGLLGGVAGSQGGFPVGRCRR